MGELFDQGVSEIVSARTSFLPSDAGAVLAPLHLVSKLGGVAFNNLRLAPRQAFNTVFGSDLTEENDVSQLVNLDTSLEGIAGLLGQGRSSGTRTVTGKSILQGEGDVSLAESILRETNPGAKKQLDESAFLKYGLALGEEAFNPLTAVDAAAAPGMIAARRLRKPIQALLSQGRRAEALLLVEKTLERGRPLGRAFSEPIQEMFTRGRVFNRKPLFELSDPVLRGQANPSLRSLAFDAVGQGSVSPGRRSVSGDFPFVGSPDPISDPSRLLSHTRPAMIPPISSEVQMRMFGNLPQQEKMDELRRLIGELPGGTVQTGLESVGIRSGLRAGDDPSEVITRIAPDSFDEVIRETDNLSSLDRIIERLTASSKLGNLEKTRLLDLADSHAERLLDAPPTPSVNLDLQSVLSARGKRADTRLREVLNAGLDDASLEKAASEITRTQQLTNQDKDTLLDVIARERVKRIEIDDALKRIETQRQIDPRFSLAKKAASSDDPLASVRSSPHVQSFTEENGRITLTMNNGVKGIVRRSDDIATPAQAAGHASTEGASVAGRFILDAEGVGQIDLTRMANKTTFDHETVHWAKELGLFTDDEWSRLSKKFAGSESEISRIEELIADGLANSSLTERGIIQRVKEFFARLYESATGRTTATGTVERFRKGDIFSRSTDVPLERLAASAQSKTRPKLLALAQSGALPPGGEKTLRSIIRAKSATAQATVREKLLNPTFLTPENASDLIGFSRDQNVAHRAMQEAGSQFAPRFSLVDSGPLASALKDSQIGRLEDVQGTVSSAFDFFKSLGSKKGLRELLTTVSEKMTDDLIRARQVMLRLAGGKNVVAGKAAAHVLLKTLSGLLGNARAIMQRGIHDPTGGKNLYSGNMVQDLLKPITDHLAATRGKFTQADIEEALHIADHVAVSRRAIGEYDDMLEASSEYQKFLGADLVIDSPLRLRGVISEADETRFLNMNPADVQRELREKVDTWADTITGRTQVSHRAIIDDAGSKGVLEMADAVGDVTRKINRAKLDYVFKKGFIKEEHYKAALTKQDYFTPFQRVLDDEQARTAHSSGGDLWHVFKGSEKDILNPVQSTIDSTIRWMRRADINEVFQRMIQNTDAESLAELGIRRVKKDTANAIPIWIDGERSFYAFKDKKLLDSFMRIGKAEPTDAFTKVLSSVSRVIKGSVTHHPGFAMRNFVKDSVARAILSDTGSGVLDAVPGLHKFADDEVERFIFAGGDQAGFYDRASENYARKLHVAIRQAATDKRTIFLDPARLGDLASGTWEKWGDIVGKSETLNRMAEFRSALKDIRIKHPNISSVEAERLAAYKARDLLDFAVAGEFGRKLNRFIPFLNPAIQGTSKMLRTARENPARFMKQLGIYVAAPSIGNLAYNEAVGAGQEYRFGE